MHMVRYGNDHGVDVLAFLIQHLPEVFVFGRLFEAGEGVGGAPVIPMSQDNEDICGRGL